jgi:hypothetical protein
VFATQSNPIRERLQRLELQWEAFTAQPQARVARWLAQANETDMVELFIDYLSALDSPSDEMPLLLRTPFVAQTSYGGHLLDELAHLLACWNQTPRGDERIPWAPVDWSPTDSGPARPGSAAHFVEQFNALAEALQPPEGCFLVAVLQPSSLSDAQAMNAWLEKAIRAGISPRVRLMLLDDTQAGLFQKVAATHPKAVLTLVPRLGMGEATRQLAAAGDPSDPATQFRQAYVALLEAINQRAPRQVEQQAALCLAVVEKQLPRQPHWYAMQITVLSALANDQIGYQNYRKALDWAHQGVAAAQVAQTRIGERLIGDRLLAQARMLRAGLLVVVKDWGGARQEYGQAALLLKAVSDPLLAMEAFRMAGYAAVKAGDARGAIPLLIEGLYQGDLLPEGVAARSTYPGLVEQLLPLRFTPYLSASALEALVGKQLGPDWAQRVRAWQEVSQVVQPRAEPQAS